MNILIIGAVPRTAKAVTSAGGNVTLLFDGGERLPRNIAEIREGSNQYFLSKSVDNVSLLSIFAGAMELYKVIQAKSIKVIHANGTIHLLKAWLAKIMLALSGSRKPAIVISMHASTPWVLSINRRRNRMITQVIRRCADLAIPLAEFLREIFISYGINPDKAITIHNCIDFEQFDKLLRLPFDSSLDFLASLKTYAIVSYVASLHSYKGHEYYLQAAQRVLREEPRTKFLVVGNGPRKKVLEQLAQELGIDQDIIFTGDIPPVAVPQLLSLSDVPVCASLSEMCPYFVLEAMAAGKAIVATTVGGIPDLVDHQVSGILVPPGDGAALAEGILSLLRNPGERQAMGQAARQLAESRNNLQVIGRQLMRAYSLALMK